MKDILYNIGDFLTWITFKWDKKHREWVCEFTKDEILDFIKKITKKNVKEIKEHKWNGEGLCSGVEE